MRTDTCTRLAFLSLFGAVSTSLHGGPSIQFTYVPPIGSYQNITGVVSNASPATYGVALLINIFGIWWTKPTLASPITTLNSDGTFTADITTGGADSLDAYAQESPRKLSRLRIRTFRF